MCTSHTACGRSSFLGFFCRGMPSPTFAQPSQPPIVENVASSPKIVARLGSAAFDLVELVSTVAWSADGRFLVSAAKSTTRPGQFEIDLWKAETGERIWRKESQVQQVRALEFSSDGRTVIETGIDRGSAFDAATGNRVPLTKPMEAAVSAQLKGNRHEIVIKNAPARKQELTIACPKEKDVFLSFRFSPDRRFLATGSRSGDLLLWDVAAGGKVRDFETRIGEISSLEFTPDGELLIAAGSGQNLYAFHTDNGRQRFRFDNAWRHTLLAVDPQGKRLASAERLSGTVSIWNLKNGRLEQGIRALWAM